MPDFSRRRLLKTVSLASVYAAGGALSGAHAAKRRGPTLCMFSKHLPFLGYRQLGQSLKQIGFGGVDLTVRPKGHVLPEHVARDLPRAIEAIRGEGIDLPMITTDLTSPDDPAARPTLQTAGRLDIPYYKLGYYHYGDLTKLDETLERVKRSVEGIAAIGRHASIQGGFHTHSGSTIGAVMWDNWWIQRDIDPEWMGFYYDPCHATIEGGSWGWKVGFHRLASRVNMVSLKDFYWEKRGGEWRVRMCPLGEGMVRFSEFFKMLAASGFRGPLSVHLEYEVDAPTESGRREKTLAVIEKDCRFLEKQIAAAY